LWEWYVLFPSSIQWYTQKRVADKEVNGIHSLSPRWVGLVILRDDFREAWIKRETQTWRRSIVFFLSFRRTRSSRHHSRLWQYFRFLGLLKASVSHLLLMPRGFSYRIRYFPKGCILSGPSVSVDASHPLTMWHHMESRPNSGTLASASQSSLASYKYNR